MKAVSNEKCGVCGNTADFEIQEKAVLLREAHCSWCGASIRNSDVAKQVIKALGGSDDECLADALPQLSGFRILNTCSTGALHDSLKRIPGYVASEYYDDVPNGEHKGAVVSADLMNLPFHDESFDMVISEDVFEHIYIYEGVLGNQSGIGNGRISYFHNTSARGKKNRIKGRERKESLPRRSNQGIRFIGHHGFWQ